MKNIEEREKILRARLAELDGRLHRIEDHLEEAPDQDWNDNAIEAEMDEVLDEYDDCVVGQLDSADGAREAVPRALLCRYLKRITAHLMNVITSLVMPLERLDYYDEKKADRETRPQE